MFLNKPVNKNKFENFNLNRIKKKLNKNKMKKKVIQLKNRKKFQKLCKNIIYLMKKNLNLILFLTF